jgi:hypothetical protein
MEKQVNRDLKALREYRVRQVFVVIQGHMVLKEILVLQVIQE